MEQDFIPRPEFELFCRSVNGSLYRIEAAVRELNTKLDALAEADTQRVPCEIFDRQRDECREEFRRLRGRPSWAVTAIIGALGTGLATTLTLLLTGMIK